MLRLKFLTNNNEHQKLVFKLDEIKERTEPIEKAKENLEEKLRGPNYEKNKDNLKEINK